MNGLTYAYRPTLPHHLLDRSPGEVGSMMIGGTRVCARTGIGIGFGVGREPTQIRSKSMEGLSTNSGTDFRRRESMRGVWQCRSVIAGTIQSRLVLCRHWQVHNGHRRNPRRIDVHCDRCGRRHQHRPSKTDSRGVQGSLRYVRFPDDVHLDILIHDCSIRNRNPEQFSIGFSKASQIRRK